MVKQKLATYINLSDDDNDLRVYSLIDPETFLVEMSLRTSDKDLNLTMTIEQFKAFREQLG